MFALANTNERKKIRRRDWNEVIGTDHLVDADYNENTSAEELFGASGSCMLDPEVTEGPLCELQETPCFELQTLTLQKGFVANKSGEN